MNGAFEPGGAGCFNVACLVTNQPAPGRVNAGLDIYPFDHGRAGLAPAGFVGRLSPRVIRMKGAGYGQVPMLTKRFKLSCDFGFDGLELRP